MPATYEGLMSLRIPDQRQRYSARDVMLYALSLGLGTDPMDAAQLPFVYERQLQALPTLGVCLAHPGFWPRDLDSGLDWVRIVHGGQDLQIHRPLPIEAEVIGQSRIAGIVDKGAGKGALVLYERRIVDAESGEALCTNLQTMFCRGDGGIGGPPQRLAELHAIPPRPADRSLDQATSTQMALLYRLNGDVNPLHADPQVAQRAGYERPILQGLASFGVAGWNVVSAVCRGDPACLRRISARFSAPVYPGETLRTEIWHDGSVVSFRVRVPERGVTAIDNGYAEVQV